nr:YbjN domain-containing protein [Propionibacterium sp.]
MSSPDVNSEVSGFDIDRSNAEAWAAFAARLADVVSVMEDDAALTIGAVATEHDGPPPFVAFRALPGGRILAEAATNAQLGRYFQLTADQLAAMEGLGWRPPASDASGGRPAFWAEGTEEEAHRLADLAVAALREVYGIPHPAFLAPDQLAEILTPPAPAELPVAAPDAGLPALGVAGIPDWALTAILPVSREHLDQLVLAELVAEFGHAPVRDEAGDFGIRVGSTMVFVRSSGDGREVLVFAPVVHDVEGRSRAMEVLSDLNTETRFVRFLLVRDRVFVSLSLFARPFVAAHLRQALGMVSVTADAIDNELAAKLRGRTTFREEGGDHA